VKKSIIKHIENENNLVRVQKENTTLTRRVGGEIHKNAKIDWHIGNAQISLNFLGIIKGQLLNVDMNGLYLMREPKNL
jgi:hypothetical protein